MKILQAIGPLLVALGLTAGVAGFASGQPYGPARPVVLDNGRALTEEEARAFDARLRAAGTDQVRAKIAKERDDLIRARLAERDSAAGIPASRHELSDDLIMLDVPTPPLDRPWQPITPAAGALAPMGYGTRPFGFPDASSLDEPPPRP